MDQLISLKVYATFGNINKTEVRRFTVPESLAVNFSCLSQKIVDLFPNLANKTFFIFWTDEDEDKILISSDEELATAIAEMKTDVKKLYVELTNLNLHDNEDGNNNWHPMIYCDECDKKVKGLRYKCLVCEDYDLCKYCEKEGLHFEHAMLRIADPFAFDRKEIQKLMKYFALYKHSHHGKKRHFFDYVNQECNFKEKRDKSETSPKPSGTKDNFHKKRRCLGKWKHLNVGTCKQFMDEYLQYLDPVYFDSESKKKEDDNSKENSKNTTEVPPHVTYLRNIGKTITSLLDPLGIDVDIEVKPSVSKEENENKEKKSKSQSDIKLDQHQSKSVNSTPPNGAAEASNSVVDEITRLFSHQLINESTIENSKENKNSSASVTKENSKVLPKEHSKTSSQEQPKTNAGKSTPSVKKQALYPNLNHETLDPHINQALEYMTEMGFENDGGWLTQLLIAKNGDIEEVLKVLTRS